MVMMKQINKAEIRWGCRRGMLELDMLLLSFFDQQFDALTAEQQASFVKLLECEDQDLFRWLLGNGEPENNALKEIISLISGN